MGDVAWLSQRSHGQRGKDCLENSGHLMSVQGKDAYAGPEVELSGGLRSQHAQGLRFSAHFQMLETDLSTEKNVSNTQG